MSIGMEPLRALEHVERILRKRGYATERLTEEGEHVLKVALGQKLVFIRFHEERGLLKELRLRYEGHPGLTILKCDDPEKPARCIEELLSRIPAPRD